MMRIIKERDDNLNGWYYADSKGRRVSPTYEHEGMLDKWAEVNGAFNTFVVLKRKLENGEEEYIAHYNDYETANRAYAMEKKSDRNPQIFISIREEKWMPIDEAE
jgi:hypothetical protein